MEKEDELAEAWELLELPLGLCPPLKNPGWKS
jgi:hypothetical protein